MTTASDPYRPHVTDLSLASQRIRNIIGGYPATMAETLDAAQDLLAVLDRYVTAELAAPPPLHLRIVQGSDLIADLPGWPYQVPRVGDYIFHPPLHGDRDRGSIAGCVKTVIWRTHDRGDGEFVMTARPYVEITI